MKKWYNIELNQKDAERLQEFLYETDIRFEISGCFDLVHFEIEMVEDGDMFHKVLEFINNELFKDAIFNKEGEI